MSDWRLNGQEDYLSNKTLYKITFPEFWEIAYKDKNAFYCTEDMYYWICEECFQYFQSKFNWQVGTTEELLSNSEL